MKILQAALAMAMLLALSFGGKRLPAREADVVLPNGWVVRAATGIVTQTGTMPQAAAISKDGKVLAVVESGFNPPALRLLNTTNLEQIAAIRLRGAFGRPIWRDDRHVVVAGANADALFDVDTATLQTREYPLARKTYPIAVALAPDGVTFAVATDGDGAVRIGSLEQIGRVTATAAGEHPAALAFSADAKTLFVSIRSKDYVRAINTQTGSFSDIRVGLHPGDLLLARTGKLYVAETDSDEIGIVNPGTAKRIGGVFVGDRIGERRVAGVSVNALSMSGSTIYASLGAANAVAVVQGDHVVGRIDAGWYPTDVIPLGSRIFIINGKGERSHANPYFDPRAKGNDGYVASLQVGSVRVYDLARQGYSGNPQGAIGWALHPGDGIVRTGGPIRHVFFILKENRSYDQVLGDVRAGNGDPTLVWFGQRVTPNQHALARRFGLFDNAYASGEVSDSGHKWANSAFANDYAERFWPPAYGGRRDLDDLSGGEPAGVPRNGFVWDAAARAHVSFRDYGELIDHLLGSPGPGSTTAPGLRGRFDARYVGWDLDYSDVDRVTEWRREFDSFMHQGSLPQFEFIWLPNDHTYGSRPGKPTPVAYVATNDYAVGLIVDAISHSPAWKSSAVFIIEDDAQNGADHVSDQRTTLYLASPYAKGGLQHAHYSTLSVLRTIELLLGMAPLSTYDAMAVPLNAAFSTVPNLHPYNAIAPQVDVTATNAQTAYGARTSARLDFSKPDMVPTRTMLELLAHNHRT